jgi:glutamate N-acetyltransferase/amino-acid N-acetyltransferase
MARGADALLPSPSSPPATETLVMSTGIIGQQLPILKILAGLRPQGPMANALGHGFAAWEAAARAFMTTDTFPKLRARTLTLGDGHTYRIAGIDKGAGMIHPDMVGPPAPGLPHATLLGCIATDAPVAPAALQAALDYAVQRSFNAISVDGEMSTNDTVVLFANGAGVRKNGSESESESARRESEIDEARDPRFERFRDGLTSFMQELAQLVVRDGEGATKFVTISVEVRFLHAEYPFVIYYSVAFILYMLTCLLACVVQGARSYDDAHKVASRISTSALVKTALYGEDAKYGSLPPHLPLIIII